MRKKDEAATRQDECPTGDKCASRDKKDKCATHDKISISSPLSILSILSSPKGFHRAKRIYPAAKRLYRAKRIYHCLCLGLIILGCDTRRDILDDHGVWVRLEADWAQAGIRPAGTSFYVFSQETGERTALLLTNEMDDHGVTRDSVKLHAGHYSLLVMNETERSHDYLSFRGTDRYLTAEAYANPLTLPANSRYARSVTAPASASTNTAVAASEVLAAAHIDHFEVDYDMIRSYARPLLRFVPRKLNTVIEVIVHVQHIGSLHTSAQQAGSLNNMAGGVFLATEAHNAVAATHWFTLTPDLDLNNGTLRAAFATFGALTNESNAIMLYFLLRDGTELTVECDVTSQLPRSGTTLESRLTVEVGLGTPDDPLIILPDIPTGDDGMFEVDVGDWGNNTDIDITI
jgi:hypothetical protein